MNRILTLTLTQFRNHSQFGVQPEGRSVILTGPNGVGKTNVLEAISLLSPGRGLRKAKLGEMASSVVWIKESPSRHPREGGNLETGASGGIPAFAGMTAGDVARAWTVAAYCDGLYGATQIGTAQDTQARTDRRVVRIDGKNVSQMALANHLAILWQTPQMDGVFQGGGTERRAFLDRLVYSIDSAHASRVNAYEQAMRERNRLLADEARDPGWLDALEARMAAEGVAIAAARRETLARLNDAMQAAETSFPKARLTIEGSVERMMDDGFSATDAEMALARQLADGRRRDAGAGRALNGPHRSVLSAFHLNKQREAAQCSTGEQKAVLLAILLAHARARAEWLGAAPVLLLDEVVAHLDMQRRAELFGEIAALGAQAWLTGTDAADFSACEAPAVRVDFAVELAAADGADNASALAQAF